MDPEDFVASGLDECRVLTNPDGSLELHQTPHSEIVLWAYSTVGALMEACGSGQPYVSATQSQVVAFTDMLDSAVLIALDAWHPDGARYPEPDVRDREPLALLDEPEVDLSVVWVPTMPTRVGDRVVGVELYHETPGVPLLAVFTSVESLIENCGPHQAAGAVPRDCIGAVAREAGARAVVVDRVMARDSRRVAPVLDWTRRNHFG